MQLGSNAMTKTSKARLLLIGKNLPESRTRMKPSTSIGRCGAMVAEVLAAAIATSCAGATAATCLFFGGRAIDAVVRFWC